MKKVLILISIVIISGIIFILNYEPPLSEKTGQIETQLYLGDSTNQHLIVAFGGGGGGNDWSRAYMKGKRDELLKRGYAILAIGYFNSGENTPDYLDRISLNAIADSIFSITARNKKINPSKIGLIGSSKGGELVLNLASRYKIFHPVIAMSTSHVSFPALTIFANTSSWRYNGHEVPYVAAPLKTIIPALKGDLYGAFNMMLENKEAVAKSEIKVENINGPILILSAKDDEQWAATEMSNKIIQRLEKGKFPHTYKHIILDGQHIEPLNHFERIYEFLENAYD